MAMNINRFGIINSYENKAANMSKSERMLNEMLDDEEACVKKSDQNHDSIELSDDYKKWLSENSQA